MNSQERIDKVLDRLKNVKSGGTGKWTALCPAHDDNERSLGIGERDDGRIWVKCHAGCTRDAVLAALNLESRDLLPSPGRQPEASQQRRIAATYDYTDESGNLLYQAVRFAPKGFAQRRPDGRGGWIWNLNGVRRVPYRLPELLDAVKEGGVVFICEGEKDCDNLWELDLPATTNAGGAGKWSDDFCAFFRGVSVVILPDNDLPGQEHAHKVAASLYSVADAVVVVDLPGLPEKGDVSDWLKDGGSCDQLVQLAMRAPIWEPKPEVPSPSALSSDERRNAQVVCLSDVKPESVSWLWRGRIPFGKLTLLDGDPGLGKSTLSLDLAARLSVGGTMPGDTTPVEAAATLLLTAEDGLADTVRPRLEAAGADVTRIHALRDVPETGNDDGRTTFRPPMLPDDIALMKEIVQKHGVRLIVIDPLMAFLSGRVKSFHDQDVRRARAPLAAMAEETGAAVLVLRHLNKMQGEAPCTGEAAPSASSARRGRRCWWASTPTTRTGACLPPSRTTFAPPQNRLPSA